MLVQDTCCNVQHGMHAVLLLICVDLQGMVPVILSWFVSPILAFIATSILFLGVRTLVLRRKNSFNLGCIALPFLVGLTFFVIVVFIIQTGMHECATRHCYMCLVCAMLNNCCAWM